MFPDRFRSARVSPSLPRGLVAAGLALLVAAGCTRPEPGTVTRAGQAFDPYEAHNREVHELNKSLDRAVLRPAGVTYAALVPEPVNELAGNFADNLGAPSDMVNSVLQGRLDDAAVTTVRFVMNSTIGVGGLIDAATAFGIAPRETDFGETLAVWGVPQGAYQELPVLGPSTERATAGMIVDLFTNPLRTALDPSQQRARRSARVAHLVGERGYRRESVDSILRESADSYAQLRLIYLQNRRHQLGAAQEDAYLDPYDDSNGQGDGPYIDPYIDPYAE